MNFDQFLEKDILSFLEGKIERKGKQAVDREEEYGLYLTKDYLKELNSALDNDELTRAKKLFDELKQNYNNLPNNSLERKKVYGLLEQMYSKIEAYVKMRSRADESKTPVPLIVSSQIDAQNANKKVDKLDMQDSIIEKQLENLDKKFSSVANEVTKIENTLENKPSVENVVLKVPDLSEIKKIDTSKVTKKTADSSTLDKSIIDKHDNSIHDKEKNKPVELFKIDKQPIPVNAVNALEKISKTSKTSDMDNAAKIGEEHKSDAISIYKIPHPTTENKSESISKENRSKESGIQEKIHSYKKLKEQPADGNQDGNQLSTVPPAVKIKLEGFDHVEKMYFEGIYLFYNHNYQEASKLFETVLTLRPRSKAAKIRLQECAEAIESG